MFKTVHRTLTKDQKSRGIVFSSALIRKQFEEMEADTIHEVESGDPKRYEKIQNLKDVRFFKNMAESCNWDVIHIVREE